jgi:dihydroxy-acid dehydratase
MHVQWRKTLRLTRFMSKSASNSEIKLNKYSSILTEHKSRGAAQAMLYATGIKEQDITKPQVGIASMWWEGNPCNMHLLDLAMEIKKGVEKEDMVGLRFNTIGVSDGISMYVWDVFASLQIFMKR